MNPILNFDTIHEYNEFLGVETLHPLINSIDFSEVKKDFHHIPILQRKAVTPDDSHSL